jgi:riboflavin kinase / FMN adenylyltransferase
MIRKTLKSATTLFPPPWTSGSVVHGDGRGRSLGFPTANLRILDQPEPGIYACRARLASSDIVYQAVMHSGPRPTIPEAKPSLEVHLLDFPDRDLYDETLGFKDVIRIRDIKKFASLDELTAAIAKDIQTARQLLTP